ncbi:uncharacterized protein AB675_8641 [Cyphellophora attinorum]|uniref:Uncharacterized protein n=1 Tax=Cyphellophora attinorum TaxID=1664694 RepID=A0A0N1HGK5_9EURO|nr:uncharacterized protein AB675_8641 [Phialophora attinorum]KPI44762.1 hypothetical protein AB675_8641 [Phialophora attinorum]
MAATDHNKHGLFSHQPHGSNYSDNHKHFHANSSAPAGFHLPHHASTTPNLSKVDSISDDEPTFPPHPPQQHQRSRHNSHTAHDHPERSHTIPFPHPHLENYVSHHQREMSFGHDSRHAKHDAAREHTSSPMPSYVQEPKIMSEAEEIALFAEQERERKRREEQAAQDKKSWEEVLRRRERARRTSGAFDDRKAWNASQRD